MFTVLRIAAVASNVVWVALAGTFLVEFIESHTKLDFSVDVPKLAKKVKKKVKKVATKAKKATKGGK